jgi:hypothetical protein
MAQQGGSAPNQGDAGERLLGYGNNIDGIPLDDDMPQTESSAVPNRTDADFNTIGDRESDYAVDYFDAEESRLGDPISDAQAKTDENWSDGISDEENMEFAEQTDDVEETDGLPEMGPIDVIEKPTPQQLDPSSSGRYLTEE